LGLGAALILALALWWTGRRQGRGRAGAFVPGLLGAMLALGSLALVGRSDAAAKQSDSAAVLDAEPFSEATLMRLRGENRPVFAYFTADWCVTCKVNEKAVLDTQAVAAAFDKGGVQVLVGDWTDGDPALGRFIEQHNRAGVPLYLWYAPGAAAPRVLPQILTPSMLTELPADGAGA
ncbi:thioredoxin family protein, partial [Sphingomonas sp.]|uniref:thioredoxin family protein n=1 Tax=Sphingomonas sp. TaxID=28214 RepID=UPI002BE30806